MTTSILRTATRFMMPLLLLFSVFLLLRGHNQPGGGFVGGLVAAVAFALEAMACGAWSAREALGVEPRRLVAGGLLTALLVTVVPLAWGVPLLTQRYAWIELAMPGGGWLKLGPPLLFDLGVYFVVIGVALTIILTLVEE